MIQENAGRRPVFSFAPVYAARGFGSKMPKRRIGMKCISVLFVVAGALFGAAPALATEFCDIREMPGGFLALRAEPKATSKLVARMKPGDEVMLNNTVAEKNGWTRVYWWKGGRFTSDGAFKGLSKVNGEGWVNSKLLGDECG
jgi:hypothetical protein